VLTAPEVARIPEVHHLIESRGADLQERLGIGGAEGWRRQRLAVPQALWLILPADPVPISGDSLRIGILRAGHARFLLLRG
jgi:hypothetical protein